MPAAPQARLHGFPLPLQMCKCSAGHGEQRSSPSLPGLHGMSREQPVPLQAQRWLCHPCPPMQSVGTEGAGPVLGLERRPTSPALRSRGKGVNPPRSSSRLHGLSHTALAPRLRVDQENWPPLRRARFRLPGPLSTLPVGGLPARRTPINRPRECCTASPSHSLPSRWDIRQWLWGERP